MGDNNTASTKLEKKKKRKKRDTRVRVLNVEQKEIEEINNSILNVDSAVIGTFSDLPLSGRSQQGLEDAGYTNLTDIQKQGIPLALKKHDVLGAAKTGSGKTLAFLIPVLECLWKLRWSSVDGLGALVISPTRELAYQTFEVLRKIGKHHDISAGLIIGGKELSFEQQRIQKTNIIVCTPGRLLQHMDETPNFDCSTLKILVLDEADRILDMGFSETVNGIIENLPEERQTLLYSATQTSSVSDLARLSLRDPEYVSVHQNADSSTPQKLKQSYVVCALEDKINFVFSFIKSHLKSKILVFLSSCKQVKFTYEAFRRLRPGVPLMALYGKQHQVKRVATYNDFCRKTSAVLFATDIAARGLDFPAVHWVLQLDCPEDANTYIHRAGRTARYQSDGHSLLMLLPSEEKAMLKELEAKKVPITEIQANPKKLNNIQKKLEVLCVQDQTIKQWAQKSVVSYVRSVYLQSNKKVFNVKELHIDKYAISLGLLLPPRIRFLQKAEKKRGGNQGDGNEELLGNAPSSKPGTSDEQDFLILRERNIVLSSESEVDEDETNGEKIKTKVSSAKKVLKKKIKMNSKIVFDDEGEAVVPSVNEEKDNLVAVDNDGATFSTGGIDLHKSSLKLVKQDKLDKRVFRDKVKQKHRDERMKEKQNRKRPQEDGVSLTTKEDEHNPILEKNSDDENNQRSKSKRKKYDSDDHNPTSLQTDEELALQLLEE